jgi:hypothetical protein
MHISNSNQFVKYLRGSPVFLLDLAFSFFILFSSKRKFSHNPGTDRAGKGVSSLTLTAADTEEAGLLPVSARE